MRVFMVGTIPVKINRHIRHKLLLSKVYSIKLEVSITWASQRVLLTNYEELRFNLLKNIEKYQMKSQTHDRQVALTHLHYYAYSFERVFEELKRI